ncbi:MarR family transcriptional regulator [Actinoplanes oblitus]|uniref:MarR family transcriptional regulator n=1 Tax=Actinoplanes oblitus TaxID=3040509 RepID=A0ABY8WRQ6_9ACTN|nr:MarR family transcriptional regulator [Actinoplanes oblitus]WIM99530.1 MarR family transcriptional regulator [Actinoplanes oblitus]
MRKDAHLIFRRYLDAVGLNGLALAEAAGLNTTDWHALSVLEQAGPLTSGALAEQTGLTTGATTRLIDRLERAGHVRRVPDPADRRRVMVEHLANPELDVDAIVGPARRHLGALLAEYSPEQLELLFDFFEKAAPALRTATAEIRRAARDR